MKDYVALAIIRRSVVPLLLVAACDREPTAIERGAPAVARAASVGAPPSAPLGKPQLSRGAPPDSLYASARIALREPAFGGAFR